MKPKVDTVEDLNDFVDVVARELMNNSGRPISYYYSLASKFNLPSDEDFDRLVNKRLHKYYYKLDDDGAAVPDPVTMESVFDLLSSDKSVDEIVNNLLGVR